MKISIQLIQQLLVSVDRRNNVLQYIDLKKSLPVVYNIYIYILYIRVYIIIYVLENQNAFITSWNSHNDIHSVWIMGGSYFMVQCDNTELNSIMLNWNKHCYTWSSGGIFQVSIVVS